MITIVHGGQTGVDRGAHDAAIENRWRLAGYMPRDGRDELGLIPADVARFLTLHASPNYAARTEANVQSASAVLVVVRDVEQSRSTPGTSRTIDLTYERNMTPLVVDPSNDATAIARWIWRLAAPPAPMLPLEGFEVDPVPLRLMVAGPRESKWPGAQVETARLLGQVACALGQIGGGSTTVRDPLREQR
ncbi:MAG TPA: putative molybdenum carrier protein [Gaiellaceae bacterium]|nr:putative molybdenum carrier protein [Gaiellaceae bacterium]